ncbi:MAG TPA: amino acid adenylation domain-containing protein, partial [Terriglobales bacterium]|nr:amino acid adenylation domain-containing protein [Terriglobales bacterium]
GCPCVPLDPSHPAQRLQFMLEDSGARLLLTTRALQARTQLAAPGICLVEDWQSPQSQRQELPSVSADNLAYIIYTSGSTGTPKGVLLTHRGLLNHALAAVRLYGLQPTDRMLQFSSIGFDISLEEMFPTWASGGTVVFRTDDMPLPASGFLRWIGQQRMTVLDLPTAYWHELVRQMSESDEPVPPELRLVIVGGEKASSAALATWQKITQGQVRWINTYGPTEASVIATAYEPDLKSLKPIPEVLPIGRPIANTRVYLLDEMLRPVPVGSPGELHIAGDGVARGYCNRPRETAEKFLTDPFNPKPAHLYRTGDMGRYLPDGNIEYLGRRDLQVKIRGYRVEVGEVESVLASLPAVHQAVVIANATPSGDTRLVAYVVPENGNAGDGSQWRNLLKERLPEYMVPATFVKLNALPLTINGKVDRRALQKMWPLSPAARSSKSADDTTEKLLAIWRSIFDDESIRPDDNFWDLGGHSLLAARLVQRIERAFGRRLTLPVLLHAPTVAQLAQVLKSDGPSPAWSCLVPLQTAGSRPPFFCVHGVGGNIVGFRELARYVGDDQPFYGVQAQGLDGKLPCLVRVEDMAKRYLDEIRRLQPRGPYLLGGFSFGGLVAFEAAQQLQSQGEEVGLVALLDTSPFHTRSLTASLLSMLRMPSEQQLMYVLPKTVKKGIRRRLVWLNLPAEIKNVQRSCYEAEQHYQLRPYSGAVTLFGATEYLPSSHDPYARWRELALGGLEIHEISGHHGDIIVEPQVRALGAKLRACLNAAQARSSKPQLPMPAISI